MQLENKAGKPTRSTSAAPSGRFICHGFPKSSCALSEWAGPWEGAVIIYAYICIFVHDLAFHCIASQQTLSTRYIPKHLGGVWEGVIFPHKTNPQKAKTKRKICPRQKKIMKMMLMMMLSVCTVRVSCRQEKICADI